MVPYKNVLRLLTPGNCRPVQGWVVSTVRRTLRSHRGLPGSDSLPLVLSPTTEDKFSLSVVSSSRSPGKPRVQKARTKRKLALLTVRRQELKKKREGWGSRSVGRVNSSLPVVATER